MPVSFETIGAEAQPLVILDDFAPDPGVLRDYAMGARFEPALNHYPGGRAELPEAYLAAQLPAIAADMPLFADPGRGRLTITAFLSIG